MRNIFALFFLLVSSLPIEAQPVLGVYGFGGLVSDDSTSVFRLDLATGVATKLGTPLVNEYLMGIAQLPDGRVVATTERNGDIHNLIEIDPNTGELVRVIGELSQGEVSPLVGDLAVDPLSGELYGIQPPLFLFAPVLGYYPNNLYRINPDTAECILVGHPDPMPTEPMSLAFTSDGTLWSKFSDSAALVTLDPTNASILTTQLVTPPLGGWAIENLGDDTFLMSECCQAGNNQFYLVDPTSGSATFLSESSSPGYFEDLAFVREQYVVEVPTLSQTVLLIFCAALAATGVALLGKK